ncbi:unnamed protein product, partial [Prorocentrum cordatum]
YFDLVSEVLEQVKQLVDMQAGCAGRDDAYMVVLGLGDAQPRGVMAASGERVAENALANQAAAVANNRMMYWEDPDISCRMLWIRGSELCKKGERPDDDPWRFKVGPGKLYVKEMARCIATVSETCIEALAGIEFDTFLPFSLQDSLLLPMLSHIDVGSRRPDARMTQCLEALRERGEVTAIGHRGVRIGGAAAGNTSEAPKRWNMGLVRDWEKMQDSLLLSTEYRAVDGAADVNPMCDIEDQLIVSPHAFEASQSRQRPIVIGPDRIESGLIGRAVTYDRQVEYKLLLCYIPSIPTSLDRELMPDDFSYTRSRTHANSMAWLAAA